MSRALRAIGRELTFFMQRIFSCLLTSVLLTATLAAAPLDGRWRLDPAHSTALDGWTAWDLVIALNGNQLTMRHDMQLRATRFSATNVMDLAAPAKLTNFFRVEQRHMAVYPAKGGTTIARAGWLDGGRTLRIEAETPLEISQGETTVRLYHEYRLLEGDQSLVLIELRNTRPQPLVYRFNRVTEGTK